MMQEPKLGTVAASETLIQDLYIELRAKIHQWSLLTQQTPQARMGYVGQHLVSVVTGYPGSRSGARGRDLIISNNDYGEIKTCYRVDQLGECSSCHAPVSSIEDKCPVCGSDALIRKDDSKWLISIRNDDEFKQILDPLYYFLVLFEFDDVQQSADIIASIWKVNPKQIGFAYCMIDYYLTIRAKSKSKAPFNLWPYSLKFEIMKPELIYRAIIARDDVIKTVRFPGRDQPKIEPISDLVEHSRSTNLDPSRLKSLAKRLTMSVTGPSNMKSMMTQLETERRKRPIADSDLADALAR
ncbi:MAG TPA: MamI family restriction endonuclease, partial [Bacteroidota bacterium]|nr:MamI family restriction endonuclease [Bacteroidota bacterium]